MEPKLTFQLGGLVAIVLAIALYSPNAFVAIVFVAYSVVLVALTIAVTLFVYHLWHAPKMAVPTYYPPNLLYNVTKLPRFDLPQPVRIASQLPILFGRTVDGLLHQLLEYTFRDFVTPWLREVTRHSRMHADLWREDIWLAVQRLRERALRVDGARLLAVDMTVRVTVHLEKIRIAQARSLETAAPVNISTASYLATDTTELEFLRKLCEIAAIYLLPRGYSLNPLCRLLTEVIALKVLYPMVNQLTSPDFLNQKIVHHIERRLAAAALHKRSYEYAASFEDFLRVIAASQSADDLLLMRTSCVNDIIAAQTQQTVQAAAEAATSGTTALPTSADADMNGGGSAGVSVTGSNGCSSSGNSGNSSGSSDSSAKRRNQQQQQAKLRRYIQQLTYAKTQCEKNLERLGWTGGYSTDLNMSLSDILSTVVGRRQLVLFLEPLQASGLIGFHTACEELRLAARSAYHQLGSEIFYAFIRAPAPAHVRVERDVRQRMESFLLGDQGPEVFYEAQRAVLRRLEDQYYGPFLLSAEYAELKRLLATEEAKEMVMEATVETPAIVSSSTTAQPIAAVDTNGDSATSTSTLDVSNHSTYARTKLDQLQERLDNKAHALAALAASLRPESKLLAVLGKEVDWLRMEKRQLEAHLRRTELWAEHLGCWRASVQSVEVPDEKEPPQFMILVQVDEERRSAAENGGISTGWVVLRSLSEFHDLHKQLRPLCTLLKSIELPSTAFKLFLPKNDRATLERAKKQIQRYLNFILEEDVLYQSEAIYAFLSPSSENLKQASVSPKKPKFSLLTLFKPNGDLTAQQQQHHQQQLRANDPFWGPCGPRDSYADISTLLDGSGGSADADSTNGAGCRTSDVSMELPAKDSIAEPLYALMGEIFDMGGVFKWLRRSIISFVQITYGRTINRQIRDTVHAAFDEPQLHAYVSAALQSFWPGGELAAAAAARSEDMQQMTATAAQSLLVDNMPEWVCSLVGAQTARHGALKVWRAVQNAAWNKQLFYELLEILMVELFPEIRQLK